MDRRVKILVVGTPRLLREVVVEILAESPRIEVVADLDELLTPGAAPKLLALSGERGVGLLCEVRAQPVQVGELSPESLRDAVAGRNDSR